MSHVKSDDSGGEAACGRTSPPEQHQGKRKRSRTKDQGSEDADGEEGDKSNEEQQPKMEVIGEGLPLLTRLRMLREKEERERKMREKRKSSKEEPEAEKREKPKEEEQESKSKPVEVIGEGLPLLTRLRMLREKEEREAAASAAAEKSDTQPENGTRRKASLNAVGASAPTSPSPTSEEEVKSTPAKTDRKTAPGRGKFLIQRLILQKAREEKEKENQEISGSQRSTSQPHGNVSEKDSSSTSSDATLPAAHPCIENADGSSVNVSSTATTASQISVAIVPPRTRDLNQSECELQMDSVDRRFSADKGHLSEFGEEVQDTCTRTTLAQVTGPSIQTLAGDSVSINQDSDAQSTSASNAVSCVIVQVEAEEVGEGEMIGQVTEEPENELCSAAVESKKEHRTAKPHMLHLRGEKNYVSVDDLSPEYSGLPFVKKLKILNDRQRLAELEKSSSLDSGDCLERTGICYRNLSRSFSDASYISHLGPPVTFRRFDSLGPPQTLTLVKDKESDCDERIEEDLRAFSPESNETLERRNLKSILKKLSGSIGGEEVSAKAGTEKSEGMTNNVGATARDLCQLMHAPTVEGYAARHSKLTKSVTFNRDTLASPPRTPTTTSVTPTSPVLFTPEASITSTFHEKQHVVQELSSLQLPSISNLNSTGVLPPQDRVHFIHQGSRDHRENREEYFEEVIFGIKQVIQNHLINWRIKKNFGQFG
ncbi:hypothetical protein J437_LFUL000862 [Ladona fulva]|uniref:Uncharacterized protein n=1 Tax=Ladona fulva TaxID=123851 RepID=A0A8K0JTQ0_LADFU|nr:hypothetical protein J437_LFUL000862 [Ladona fulva]